MTEFTYGRLTEEMLRATIDSLLAYPMVPDESHKNKSTKIMEGNKLDITITDRNRSYGDSRVYRYLINKDSVLRFEQIPYPECCGIAIIKNFSANRDMQKADFLDAMDGFIKDIKQNDRYSKVLFYTAKESAGDKLFSQLNGITILDSFANKRSGNTLVGFEIDLLDSESRKIDSVDFHYDFDEEETEDDDFFDVDPDVRLSSPQQVVPAESISGGRPINSGRGIFNAMQAANPIYWTPPPYFNSDNPTGINRSSDNS